MKHIFRPSILAFLVMTLCGEHPAWATTYYISSSGDDSQSGLSPEEAWRTVANVNQTTLVAGDQVLFERGGTFAGPLKFEADDQGSATDPIVVSSFGLDKPVRATISGGLGGGIEVFDVSGLEIRNLVVEGAGAKINQANGILICASSPGGASDIQIERVDVFGFGKDGISLGARGTEKGYRNVRITHCHVYDNLRTGIRTWGPWGPSIYAHSQLYVAYCQAFRMKGGSGITLSSVNGGIVERSIAHDNGEEFSGAAGIWAWDCNDITLQYNESYRNRTIGVDGDGFDLDGGTTNSVMQYNYSHDNDAAGFLLAQYAGAPQAMRNIVIRYNISENDCRKKDYGAIHVWNGEKRDRVSGVQIYHNTIFLSTAPGNDPSAIALVSPARSVAIYNNIFFTSAGQKLVSVCPEQDDLRFQNNAYWSGGREWRINWGGVEYGSGDAWLVAAPNQERTGSRIMAIFEDPMLTNPGGGGTLGSTDLLHTLTAYKLKAGSPLISRAMDLTAISVTDPEERGFFGDPISRTDPLAIGANVRATPSTDRAQLEGSSGSGDGPSF